MSHIELDSPDGKLLLGNSPTRPRRILRICKGSGVFPVQVEELLVNYSKFSQMVKTMGGKNGLFSKNMDPSKMSPQQIMKMREQMTKMVPPQLLKQMGKNGQKK